MTIRKGRGRRDPSGRPVPSAPVRLVIARCSVDYSGRLSAHLPTATRLLMVKADGSGFMAAILPTGMRAVSTEISPETGAGGFILPGDRVDVLLSRQIQNSGGAGNEFRSETVMRNVKVLAIDQVTKPEDNAQSVVGATATLEVGAVDAEVLAQADAQGDIALVLRSYADVGGPSGATARPQLARDSNSVRVWRDGAVSAIAVQ